MTFSDCVAIEPRLTQLENDIKAHATRSCDGEYCANVVWYREFKPRMLELVGDYCENPMMRGADRYMCCYDHLYKLLPNCKHEYGICM